MRGEETRQENRYCSEQRASNKIVGYEPAAGAISKSGMMSWVWTAIPDGPWYQNNGPRRTPSSQQATMRATETTRTPPNNTKVSGERAFYFAFAGPLLAACGNGNLGLAGCGSAEQREAEAGEERERPAAHVHVLCPQVLGGGGGSVAQWLMDWWLWWWWWWW